MPTLAHVPCGDLGCDGCHDTPPLCDHRNPRVLALRAHARTYAEHYAAAEAKRAFDGATLRRVNPHAPAGSPVRHVAVVRA